MILDNYMFAFGFINLFGDHGGKQVDEMNAFQNKPVKFTFDKYVYFLLDHLSDGHHYYWCFLLVLVY